MKPRSPFRTGLVLTIAAVLAAGCSPTTESAADRVVEQAALARERAQVLADRAALADEREEVTRMHSEVRRLSDELDLRESILRYSAAEEEAEGDAEFAAEAVPDEAADVEPADAEAAAAPFYDALDDAGSWFESDDYGYVWQPDLPESDPGWAPYTDGDWTWTDYGWTWVDAQPWGAITSHYGRWACLGGSRWIWVPGLDWAPAWVSWRVGDDCIGWAPLPPDCRWRPSIGVAAWVDGACGIGPARYCFVLRDDFAKPGCRKFLRPRDECVDRFGSTRNATRLVDAGSRRARSDGGPRRDSSTPERRVRFLARGEFGTTATSEGDLAAMRVAPGRAASPDRVGGRIARTALDRGWDAVADPDSRRDLRRRVAANAGAALRNSPVVRTRQETDPSARPATAGSRRVAAATTSAPTADPAPRTAAVRRQPRPAATPASPAPVARAAEAPAAPASPTAAAVAQNRPTWEELRAAAEVARKAAVERHRQESVRRQQEAQAAAAAGISRAGTPSISRRRSPAGTPAAPESAPDNTPDTRRRQREQVARIQQQQQQQQQQQEQEAEAARRSAAAAAAADEQQRRIRQIQEQQAQERARQQQIAEDRRRQQAVYEQQRQAEAQRAAREQQQRAAEQQAQQESRRRQRQAEEAQRQHAEEAQRRQAQENQRRQAEENQRRQAQEAQRRQAEDNQRRQAEESRRRQAQPARTDRVTPGRR